MIVDTFLGNTQTHILWKNTTNRQHSTMVQNYRVSPNYMLGLHTDTEIKSSYIAKVMVFKTQYLE